MLIHALEIHKLWVTRPDLVLLGLAPRPVSGFGELSLLTCLPEPFAFRGFFSAARIFSVLCCFGSDLPLQFGLGRRAYVIRVRFASAYCRKTSNFQLAQNGQFSI